MKQTTKEKYNEINQNIFNNNLFNRLDTLNDNLKTFNEIMSSFLVIATSESTFKNKTNKEIKSIVPVVSSTLKAINESIYDS